jgi:flagellar basal-body rod protein FlgG
MLADQLRQDVIANNLANATTPGYKGDRAVESAFASMLLQQTTSGAAVGPLGLGARIDDVATDQTQGSLRETGNDLDLAVAGDGFFAVRTPTGVAFTRDGAFSTDVRGQIVTADGDPVLSTGNQPITIPGGQKPTIDAQGVVSAGGQVLGRLQVSLLDPKTIAKQGDDLYTGTPGAIGAKGTVRQGFLEQSNVNTVREMVDLIETMRSFESDQKVSQAIDETLGKAANDIGKV